MESPTPLVFLPGWGFDARLQLLAPPWPQLKLFGSTDPAAPVEWITRLFDAAEIDRADLCGWSLGARAALDFQAACPQRVRRLLLVSVRPTFPADVIAAERAAFDKDPAGHLASFYRRAFIGQKDDGARFAALGASDPTGLTPERLAQLRAGLDYLAARSITASELAAAEARLYHGQRDLIAPLAELQSCLAEPFATEAARVTLDVEPSEGHVPVVTPAFARWLAEQTA
jgi:malonyl-CoA O-methyltransferase